MIKVSVIIVAYRAQKALEQCQKSLGTHPWIEVIVVDNSHHNRGFSRGCNLGAFQARGEYLFFLNPDCVVKPGCIETLVQMLDRDKQVGVVAPQLLDSKQQAYLSYTRQPQWYSAPVVYAFIDTWWPDNRLSVKYWYRGKTLKRKRRVESVSGAAMMIRKSLFDQLNGFDERFFMYWEDADLCRRVLQQDYTIWYVPTAQIIHVRGCSTKGSEAQARWWFVASRYGFFKKHMGVGYASLLELWLRPQEIISAWRSQ